MQTPLFLQLIGQNPALTPANGATMSEGQDSDVPDGEFADLFQLLWQTQAGAADLSKAVAGLQPQVGEAPGLLPGGVKLDLRAGMEGEAPDLDALLQSLTVAAGGEGEMAAIARHLLEQLGEQGFPPEELLHAIQDMLEIPEAQAGPDNNRLLPGLLEQLPEAQRRELVEWAGSGKALPEVATRLDGLLQAVAASARPKLEVSETPAVAHRAERSVAAGEGEGKPESGQEAVKAAAELIPKVLEKGMATEPGFDVARSERAGVQLPDAGGQRPGIAAPLAAVAPATAAEPSPGLRSAVNELSQTFGTLQAQPGSSQWGSAIGERVLWMVGRDMQRAELRLNPPQLGPVEIRVAVHNDQASVTFNAAHPLTREALEGAIPRLREMLAENNLNLADVDVGQRDAGESRERAGRDAGPAGYAGGWSGEGGEAEGAVVEVAAARRLPSGLVDDFA